MTDSTDLDSELREFAKAYGDALTTDLAADPCPFEPFTELGATRRLVATYGGLLRYVPLWRSWLVWDGTRWKDDSLGAAQCCAKFISREMSRWAQTIEDEEARKGAAKAAIRMECARSVNGILALASTEPGIAIQPDQLDADPYLVNCANGVFDLRTGKLEEHDPKFLLRKITRGAYNPNAARTEFDTFLNRIQPEADMRRFLQRLLGYSLLGKVVEHVLPIFWGDGGNGKGALVETVRFAAGDYADAADRKLLTDHGETHPTGVADLFGLRLVFCSETDDQVRLAEATMKALTGGDRIKARRMREDFWSFDPSHTVIMLTNYKPDVRGNDNGVWRRLRLIPFLVTISPQEILDFRHEHNGLEVEAVLKSEADAILTWMLNGYADWAKDGLADPAPVQQATAAYRIESNAMQRWVDDCCLTGPNFWATAKDLFASWCKWCVNENESAGNLTQFGLQLGKLGFAKDEKARPIRRNGIGLQAED